MKLKYIAIVCCLCLMGYLAVTMRTSYSQDNSKSEAVIKFKDAMRDLWSFHVIWTRNFIISALADLPDKQAVTDRLLRNQQDIGDAVIPYYGREAGNKLTELLKEHILISADVVSAAQQNNREQLKVADDKWHKNARDIAAFLSKANPNWPYKTLEDMLYEHLKLTTQEATARIKQQWTEDTKMFDAVFEQAMQMAEALSDGITKQFPNKF